MKIDLKKNNLKNRNHNTMKKLWIGLMICCAFAFYACNDHRFDFSQLHSIDANGCWGLPLADAQYSIEDIMNKTHDIPLHVGADNLLQLEYATEVDSAISSDQILHCLADYQANLQGSQSVDLPTLPPIPGVTFSLFSDTLECTLPDDQVQIESAIIKSGMLTFEFSHNCPVTLAIELYCAQLTDANGNPFSQTLILQSNLNNQISLSGYTLSPIATNKLQFAMRISGETTGDAIPETINLSYHLSVGHIALAEIRGKVAPIHINVNRSIDLRLDYIAKTMSGNFTVYNPDIRCEVYNMFPIDARIVLNEAALHGPSIPSASLIATTPATITVPASTTQFEEVEMPIASSITFNPKMNEARVAANITFNPDGFNTPTMVIREGQFIHFKVSFKLPLNVKMDNISFCDTLNFGQVDFPDIDGISNMVVRCLFENGLPLDLFCQVYFYDSHTRTIVDSLFDQTQLLIGCFGTQPSISEAYITKDKMQDISDLINCDKIILQTIIDTDDHTVCIRNDQKLRLQLGAKFNLDMQSLVSF